MSQSCSPGKSRDAAAPRPGGSSHDNGERHRDPSDRQPSSPMSTIGSFCPPHVVPAGERVIYGQRVAGVVRVTDVPA